MGAIAIDGREARLARSAAAALASSLVFLAIAVAALIVASDLRVLLSEHPFGTAAVVLLLGCYVTSFVCLHKIQKGGAKNSHLLWLLSLLAAAVPLLAVMYWLGPTIGSIVGFAEIIALIIHLVAIATV